jgi:hypothetical protein
VLHRAKVRLLAGWSVCWSVCWSGQGRGVVRGGTLDGRQRAALVVVRGYGAARGLGRGNQLSDAGERRQGGRGQRGVVQRAAAMLPVGLHGRHVSKPEVAAATATATTI